MATNLYALFGLTADAHPDVIKAAYRALAKQYHPDGAGAGNPEATAKFIELQNAYEILGNHDSRMEYDASLSQDVGEEIEVEPEASINPDEIWYRTAREHPEIDQIHEILNQYSPALANRFLLAVIDGECNDDPATFAADLERQFFGKYFGDDPDVHALARMFLVQGNRLAAKELNQAVRSLQDKDPAALKSLVVEFERIYRAETLGGSEAPQPETAVQERHKGHGADAILILALVALLGSIAAGALAYLEYPLGRSIVLGEVMAHGTASEGPIQRVVRVDDLTQDKPVNDRIVAGPGAIDNAHDDTQTKPDPDINSYGAWSICSLATLPDLSDWSALPSNASYVNEAKSRNFTVQSCRDELTNRRDLSPDPQSTDSTAEGHDKKVDFNHSSEQAKPSKRIALVIGNASYRKIAWLSNPDEDARLIAESLAHLGFDVTMLIDGTSQELTAAIKQFSTDLSAHTDMALVFYSGHAVELNSRNYLLPVDITSNPSETQIAEQSLNLSDLLQVMDDQKVPTKIVIVDACRNNPFGNGGKGTGLAPVVAPSGTFVAYSTAPGTLALDGEGDGRNSPYSLALATALRNPASTIEDTFKAVRADVMRMTSGQQVPWDGSSLVVRVSFASDAEPTTVFNFKDKAKGDAGSLENADNNLIKKHRKTIIDLFHLHSQETTTSESQRSQDTTEVKPTTSNARIKQIYDRIVGEQEVTGELQPTEQVPVVPVADNPVHLVPTVEPTGREILPPVKVLPTPNPDEARYPDQSQVLPDPEPPRPLPIPGADGQQAQ